MKTPTTYREMKEEYPDGMRLFDILFAWIAVGLLSIVIVPWFVPDELFAFVLIGLAIICAIGFRVILFFIERYEP